MSVTRSLPCCACLALGTAQLAAQDVLRETHGRAPEDAFGAHLRVASHDVDGDGVPDLIVGAPRASSKHVGSVQVRSGASGELLLEVFSDVADDRFGTSADTAGDLDGDGVLDLIVGTPLGTGGNLRGGGMRVPRASSWAATRATWPSAASGRRWSASTTSTATATTTWS